MPARILDVVVLWHMHQPDYVDGATGRARMPWTRLHALLNYYDMVRLVRETPGAKAVVNLVPSLLRQLEMLAAGELGDDYLDLAWPHPSELDAAGRENLVRDFFAFRHKTRFAEFPRLAELWEKRGGEGRDVPEGAAAAFTDQDLLDLQTLFHLVWSGRTLREDATIAKLVAKGGRYTQKQKETLLAKQARFLKKVLPAYRKAAADGVVEISCTPLNHPILPLLCDTVSAREAAPDLPLPRRRFRHPGDAWYHVRTALDETERVLGVRPSGMWPAEGAVSEEALRILQTEGVRWAATDQGVLEGSLARIGQGNPPGRHFQAWRWGGDEAPALFFRDTGMSDGIGFRYQAWDAADAVDDLVRNLENIRREVPAGRHVCALILDGENPWESYPENGAPFLRELYERVNRSENLRWTTFSEYLDGGGEVRPLTALRAGSWIRADFTTWSGHPEKNRAWDVLGQVRAAFQERLEQAGAVREIRIAGETIPIPAPDPDLVGPGCTGALAEAMAALANAESSDWFWWYGDDNPTEFGLEFDELFRRHLANTASLLGHEPDAITDIPVSGFGEEAE